MSSTTHAPRGTSSRISTAALIVRGVTKSYGSVPALRGVDLTIQAGEIVNLLGPNGAGKSTLLNIVAGLLRPDAGSVSVLGVDPAVHPREARSHLGFAPQELGLYPTLTVRRNLRFFAELAGLSSRAASARADDVAQAMELRPMLDRPARTLSGGEKRRLHAAIALLQQPPLLLLDEVTVGADLPSRTHFLDVIRDTAAAGTAICFSTHHLDEVEQLGGSVAILDQGVVIARDSKDALLRAHARPVLEVRFDRPPGPEEFPVPEAIVDGCTLRVTTDAPTTTLVQILQERSSSATVIDSIEIVKPSLDAAYLALTGRRYDPTPQNSQEEER